MDDYETLSVIMEIIGLVISALAAGIAIGKNKNNRR